jgi:hypothetical protein
VKQRIPPIAVVLLAVVGLSCIAVVLFQTAEHKKVEYRAITHVLDECYRIISEAAKEAASEPSRLQDDYLQSVLADALSQEKLNLPDFIESHHILLALSPAEIGSDDLLVVIVLNEPEFLGVDAGGRVRNVSASDLSTWPHSQFQNEPMGTQQL